MESYSKTDEVLALLNKRERGEASFSAGTTNQEESLGFRDFLPSPAAAVLHKLQRVSAQPHSAQPAPLTRSASEALKVVLGEQRPEESRKLRYTDTPNVHGYQFDSSLALPCWFSLNTAQNLNILTTSFGGEFPLT